MLDHAKPLIEPSVPAAASRAAPPLGTTRCGIGPSPCTGQRRTLQKRLERQPASAVTTSPSAGWTCASARPRTAIATLPSCRSLRRALQPRRVRGASPHCWPGCAPPHKAPPRASLQVQVQGQPCPSRQNAPAGSGKTLGLATLLAEQEEIHSRSATWQLVEGHGSCGPPECLRTGERELLWCWCIRNKRDSVVVLSSSPSGS